MKVTNLFSHTALLLGVLCFASCEQAPKSDDAKTEDAKKVDDKKAENAIDLKLDTKLSEVAWVGTKPTGKHNGTFSITEGKISVKGGEITAGSFLIDIKTLKVLDPADGENNAKLTKHLLSKDFFEAERFGTGRFEITSVAPFTKDDEKNSGEKKDQEYTLANPNHVITGNLELKGVTKSVSFPARVTVTEGKAEAEAKFNINREDWNINYGAKESLGDNFIRPTIHISLKLVAN